MRVDIFICTHLEFLDRRLRLDYAGTTSIKIETCTEFETFLNKTPTISIESSNSDKSIFSSTPISSKKNKKL